METVTGYNKQICWPHAQTSRRQALSATVPGQDQFLAHLRLSPTHILCVYTHIQPLQHTQTHPPAFFHNQTCNQFTQLLNRRRWLFDFNQCTRVFKQPDRKTERLLSSQCCRLHIFDKSRHFLSHHSNWKNHPRSTWNTNESNIKKKKKKRSVSGYKLVAVKRLEIILCCRARYLISKNNSICISSGVILNL